VLVTTVTSPHTRRVPAPKKPRPPGIQLGEEAGRAAILAGATRTFARRGLRGASVEHILEAANVSRRTFYRHFASKEDVAMELYRVGTTLLLDSCAAALRDEADPLRQLERCVDAHLATTRGFARLVYVLGGEAQRSESLLHARRLEVHAELERLLDESLRKHLRKRVEPLLLRALILALESVPRLLMEEADEGRHVGDEGVARARRVMMRVVSAVLEGHGPRVTALPTV
jgi:AcrR family transcriptional regulator